MLLKIIRWARGYIVFTISGAFPERFLNLINIRGIRHWDFVPENGGYTGKMFLSDYMKIRPAARKSRVRLKSCGRVGLPFFIKKYKRRKGLLAGAVAAALILTLLSQFVWDINIVGAEGLSETELRTAFEECGFKIGMLKANLNAEEIERQVELRVPQVRWLSVNALNNVATVEIKQLAQRPKMNNKTYPCNIKASEDGVITDILVSSGTCEVKRGSAVTENQLLVNSVVVSGDESLRYVHSEAQIYADVIDKFLTEIPKTSDKIILNKNYTEKSLLNFLFVNLPFDMSPSLSGIKASNFSNVKLNINGVSLPLGKTAERDYYFDIKKQTYNKSAAEKLLMNRLALHECFCQSDSAVKKREIKLTETDDKYVLSADYIINKNIAQKQKIIIE